MIVAGLVRIWFFEVFLHWFMILMVLDDVRLVFSVMFFCMMISLFMGHRGLVLPQIFLHLVLWMLRVFWRVILFHPIRLIFVVGWFHMMLLLVVVSLLWMVLSPWMVLLLMMLHLLVMRMMTCFVVIVFILIIILFIMIVVFFVIIFLLTQKFINGFFGDKPC